ncbi:flavin reductase family protein [Pseudogracilibacillus sp. SE30717A]|uniref:flavin reductase family protein n=1 Tax=Pseudogracilibacillus sp. SE30717A TaxID=3098293 RepID=UPI00300DDF7F
MDDITFRNAMGKFTTGVTVITTQIKDDIHGMTANAFMSVSLNPKLITVSIDNRANMLNRMKDSSKFAVNILSDQQQNISKHFAGQIKEEKQIDFSFLRETPIIKDSLASIVCTKKTSYTVGDHTLFIGEVIDITSSDGAPLTFYRGKYGMNSVVS